MASITLDGQAFPVANIFCIGRNYAAHVAELGNVVEEEPLVFLKPTSALIDENHPITLPAYSQDVHHECELVLYIGKGGRHIAEQDALSHIAGYGIGLDLTARDVQSELKKKGQPWTKAKGFPSAACVSEFVPATRVNDPQQLSFSLAVNGEIRQRGNTKLMLFSVAKIVHHLSTLYGLSEGDVIFTGTPEGVSRLQAGDHLYLVLDNLIDVRFEVQA